MCFGGGSRTSNRTARRGSWPCRWPWRSTWGSFAVRYPRGRAMRAEELTALLRVRPFVPLRIHMTDGQTHDIRHPDQVLVLRQRVDIGLQPDHNTGVLERVEH